MVSVNNIDSGEVVYTFENITMREFGKDDGSKGSQECVDIENINVSLNKREDHN